jgi:glycosyltransferase involved in cell wall biosynthesis
MSKKPKVAWLSPLPPQRSGIANYSYWLVKALRPYVDLDLYCDTADSDLKNEFQVYPLLAFPQQRQKYDETIYHLGNNSLFHKEIYKYAWSFPGTIVLHDYNLSAFMHDAFYLKSDWQLYEQALANTNGESDSKGLQGFIPRLRRNVGAFPMSHAVAQKSRKVIVHHRWIRDQLPDANHIHVIPHFARINCRPAPEEIDAFKKRFQIDNNHFVIACLGFINTNKLPQLQVDVVKRLLAQGYPVHLLFAGETAPEVKRLQAEVEASEYRDNITFTGYLDDTDYGAAVFAADVTINLRNPSMGEASGTLMHALAAGKPAIVSDVNQYKEFPDRVCWKVTHDQNEAHLLYEYLTVLLSNRSVREAISENAIDYVESVLALDRIVPQWLRVISL